MRAPTRYSRYGEKGSIQRLREIEHSIDEARIKVYVRIYGFIEFFLFAYQLGSGFGNVFVEFELFLQAFSSASLPA